MKKSAEEYPGERFRALKIVNFFLKLFYRGQIFLKRSPALYSLLTFLFPFFLIFLVWALVAEGKFYPEYLFPSPFNVTDKLIELTLNGEIFRHIGASMYRLGLGFFFGFLLALPLGILIGVNKTASNFFTPPLLFSRPFPVWPGFPWPSSGWESAIRRLPLSSSTRSSFPSSSIRFWGSGASRIIW